MSEIENTQVMAKENFTSLLMEAKTGKTWPYIFVNQPFNTLSYRLIF
jgi:hypothetical protein